MNNVVKTSRDVRFTVTMALKIKCVYPILLPQEQQLRKACGTSVQMLTLVKFQKSFKWPLTLSLYDFCIPYSKKKSLKKFVA